MDRKPYEAKRDERLRNSGALKAFIYEGQNYPLEPKTAFYDWIYINALLDNPVKLIALERYDAFTDVEFNPAKSINCQARAAAIYVSLVKLNLIDKVRDFDEYLSLITEE